MNILKTTEFYIFLKSCLEAMCVHVCLIKCRLCSDLAGPFH